MKVLHQKVIEFLESNGFTSSESGLAIYDCDLFYCKRTVYDTARLCECNDKTPQLCVKAYSADVRGEQHTSYSIEICQENDLGWLNFDYYCLSEDDLINNFDKYETSLIRAWNASFEDFK